MKWYVDQFVKSNNVFFKFYAIILLKLSVLIASCWNKVFYLYMFPSLITLGLSVILNINSKTSNSKPKITAKCMIIILFRRGIVISNHLVFLSLSAYCKTAYLICMYICKSVSSSRWAVKRRPPFVASLNKNKINGSNSKHKQASRPVVPNRGAAAH